MPRSIRSDFICLPAMGFTWGYRAFVRLGDVGLRIFKVKGFQDLGIVVMETQMEHGMENEI